MEDVESKYSSLSFEFSRLRSRFQKLRQFYINLKNKNVEDIEKSNIFKRRIRQLELEIDGLNFRNDHFVQRIIFLQNEIKKSASDPKTDKNTSKKIEQNNVSEGLDFFIETTKIQLSSIMEENEQLSQKLCILNNEMEESNRKKELEIHGLRKENQILKNLKTTNNEQISYNNGAMYGRSLPCRLPCKIIDHLESSVQNCLVKIYDVIENIFNLIYDIIGMESSNDFNSSINIIKSGSLNVLKWKDLPEVCKNRIIDISHLIKPLSTGLSVLVCDIYFVNKKNWDATDVNLLQLPKLVKNCLEEVRRVMLTLSLFPSTSRGADCAPITSLLKHLQAKICKYSTNINNICFSIKGNNSFQTSILDVMKMHRSHISDTLNILNIIVENEINTLSVYGWCPSTFTRSDDFSMLSPKSIQNSFVKYQKIYAFCNKERDKPNEVSIESKVIDPQNEYPELKIQLDESKKKIAVLRKENYRISFELQAKTLSSSNNNFENQSVDNFIKNMREFLNLKVDKFFEENQLMQSQIASLTCEYNSTLIRLKLLESEKRHLEFSLKKLNTKLENANEDLTTTQKNYENRLIDLTEEICYLKKS